MWWRVVSPHHQRRKNSEHQVGPPMDLTAHLQLPRAAVDPGWFKNEQPLSRTVVYRQSRRCRLARPIR